MKSSNHTYLRRLIILAIGLSLSLAVAIAAKHIWQQYMDKYVLSHADPSMIALANEAGMSTKGKLVFLKTYPQMVSDDQMQRSCSANTAANNENGFIEQGCYAPKANRIYLRRMPPSLHKLEVSTATYEMLHPVYIAIRHTSEGEMLDKIIEADYTRLHNPKLDAQVLNFAKTEPGARDLELFSLLATGYDGISNDLQRYLEPYFDNLDATVSASKEIDQKFQELQDELSKLKGQIDRYKMQADNAYAASIAQARAGNATGNDYYYSQYRKYIQQENAVIIEYNSVLADYNKLVTEYDGSQPAQKMGTTPTP